MVNRCADITRGSLTPDFDNTLRKLSNFYGAILKSASDYKVFVGRGCSILLEITAERLSEELEYRNDIMSDAGFLLRTEEIAEYYIQNGKFPKIDLVDESIAYGRGLNTILLEWEWTLAKRLLEKGVPVPRKEVRKQLAKALRIHVLLQKNNDSLLLNDYKKIVKCSVFPRNVNEYQDNYDHLQSVLQHSDTVNAVYTVSCQMDNSGALAIRNVLLEHQYVQVQPEPIMGQTIEGFSSYDIFIRYFSSRKNPKAISVVRLFRRRNKAHLIPYVYFMDVPKNAFAEMTEEIQKRFNLCLGRRKLPELSAFGRAQNELTSTIINYKLLQSLICESKLTPNQFSFHYNQVRINLGGDERSRTFLHDLSHQPSLSLEAYHDWLNKLVDYVEQPFDCIDGGYYLLDKRSKRFVRDVVLRVVYKKSVDAECAAYHALNGGLTQKMLDRSSKRVTLPVIISHIYDEAAKNPRHRCRMGLDYVIAELMLMMDYGYVATITCDVGNHNNDIAAAHSIRVSECSLGLYPTVYAEYIPLLIEIEKQCLYDWHDAKDQLRLYVGEYQNNPELARELWRLLKSTHEIGSPIENLEWYAKRQGIKLERSNAEVQQYRRWFFDY